MNRKKLIIFTIFFICLFVFNTFSLSITIKEQQQKSKIFDWKSEQITHGKVKEMGFKSVPLSLKTPSFNIPQKGKLVVFMDFELEKEGIGCFYGGGWSLMNSNNKVVESKYLGSMDDQNNISEPAESIEPGNYHISYSVKYNVNMPYVCKQTWSFKVFLIPNEPIKPTMETQETTKKETEDTGIDTELLWSDLKPGNELILKKDKPVFLPGTIIEGQGKLNIDDKGEACSIQGEVKIYQSGANFEIKTDKNGKIIILPKIEPYEPSLSYKPTLAGRIKTGFLRIGHHFRHLPGLRKTIEKTPSYLWKNKISIVGGGAIKLMTGIPGFVFTVPTKYGAKTLGKNWDKIVDKIKLKNEMSFYERTIPDSAPKGYARTLVKSSCIAQTNKNGLLVRTFKGEVELSDINQIKTVKILPGYFATCKIGDIPSDPYPFKAGNINEWWDDTKQKITSFTPQIDDKKSIKKQTSPNQNLYKNTAWNFSIEKPSDAWKILENSKAKQVNAEAEVVLNNHVAYFMIIPEKFPKINLNTYKKYSIPQLPNLKILEEKNNNSDFLKGVEFLLSGTSGQENILWRMIIFQADEIFYQLHYWTLKDYFKQYNQDVNKIIDSFKLLK